MKKINWHDRLTLMVILFLLTGLFANTFGQKTTGKVKDIDGNIYKTVIIGDQEWMGENLKTTKYNDGASIVNEPDMTKWVHITTDAFSWVNNDEKTKETFGVFYNWFSVNTGKLCPTGWRVPSDTDWKKLTDYLGGAETASGKLKESGTGHWNAPNAGATNETGFSAIPAGYRYGYFWGAGTFYELGLNGYFWTSTEFTNTHSWTRTLSAGNTKVYRSVFVKNNGFSVRCLKDVK